MDQWLALGFCMIVAFVFFAGYGVGRAERNSVRAEIEPSEFGGHPL